MTPSDLPREWIAEAHLIARAAPGLGHPLDLTCAEFNEHLRLAIEGYGNAQSEGGSWTRRYVDQATR